MTLETGALARVEALFAQAVAVARQEDNVTLTFDPHAEAIRYIAPVLASRANAAALACNVAAAIALYRQVHELDPQLFPGDPQVIAPVLAEQNAVDQRRLLVRPRLNRQANNRLPRCHRQPSRCKQPERRSHPHLWRRRGNR